MLKAVIASLIVLTFTVSLAADDKTIHMTATDWPPYTADHMKGQGVITQLVKDTFAAAGYDLKVDFSAWQRSLATAIDSQKYIGTLVVYYIKAREKSCHFSRPVGSSILGFVQRKDTPIVWDTLTDLTGVRIGTVSGYANTEEFNRLGNEQILDVSAVTTDTLNLRRVAFGRIDLALVDKYNMLHLLNTDPVIAPYRHNLEFNSRPLAEVDMFICFRKDAEGAELRDAFNAAFDKKKAAEILAAIPNRYGTKRP